MSTENSEVTSIQPAPGQEAMVEIQELTKKLGELGQTDLVGRANGWEFRMKKLGTEPELTKRKLEFAEVNPLVVSLSQKVFKLINDELKDIHNGQRWLIQGRVMNLLFSGFYNPIIEDTEKNLNAVEKELRQ